MILTENSKLRTQNDSSKRKTQLRYRCYDFSINIIKFLKKLPNNQVLLIITNQLLRSATSIGANVIEAKSASSKRDFIRFYEISLKSANETKYWLGLLRDATETDKEKTNELLNEVEEISKMLSASILTMKNKRNL